MKFKVDDRVKYNKMRVPTICDHVPSFGDIGIITSILNDDYSNVKFDFSDGVTSVWTVHNPDLILIENSDNGIEEPVKNKRVTNIKKLLYVEDGSVDVDDLQQVLDDSDSGIYVVVYRQGSRPPELVDLEVK